MKLAGKVALVTGAGRGIGLGCALELAREGADLVINDRPGSPDLAAAADEIRALGRRCTAIEADVFSRAGCEALVAEASGLRSIDMLVSNPAFSRRGKFLEYDPELFDRVIQGSLTSGFHMSQLVARQMVAAGRRGKIVFISSVHAGRPYADSVAYNAAKAGLNHMAKTIAIELVKHRINVNLIEPGWIDTPNERQVFGDKLLDEQGPLQPWGRLGQPSDIGRAAAFLCSDDADYVTGAVLRVDGALVLRDCVSEL